MSDQDIKKMFGVDPEDAKDICGEFHEVHDEKGNPFRVHYFCLLFACNLSQDGEESEGIQGFLLNDIRREANRGQKLTCKHCKKKGATSACIVPECKMTYHFPCGRKAGHTFKFASNYP